jgi:hypothetical protein
MVSTDVQIAMFGGTDPSNAAVRETWTFDGKHWTHRQDIGPSPRFSHAISFDAARRTIVLFGGTAFPATSPLRDTWEHTETDPPTPPNGGGGGGDGGGGAGVNVLSIAVTPMSAFPGDPVVANMALTSPAPAGTQVEFRGRDKGTLRTRLSPHPPSMQVIRR